VDVDDTVIAQTSRREMRVQSLRHRAVYIAVLNAAGQLLAHQRSFTKDVAPGYWDIAVGGVVGAGESYDDAAVRELAEEIGVTGVALHPIGGGRYDDAMFKIVGQCYTVTSDGPFQFSDGEVIATQWISHGELGHFLRTKQVCGDSVALLLPKLDGQITQ
jgi:isopentenyldiphosphate isomerase